MLLAFHSWGLSSCPSLSNFAWLVRTDVGRSSVLVVVGTFFLRRSLLSKHLANRSNIIPLSPAPPLKSWHRLND